MSAADFARQVVAELADPHGVRRAEVNQAEQAAEQRGFARAVAMLRDDARYCNWWSAAGAWEHPPTGRYWDATARGHLADYLETVADLGGAS